MNNPIPTWRSVDALAESLNSGADTETFSVYALRHLIQNARENGLAQHVRRLGRKIVIDENGFRQWVAERGEAL